MSSDFYWDDGLVDRVRNALARQNYDNARDLAEKASDLAPVEHGDLRGSLEPGGEHGLFNSEAGGLIMTVGSELPYAAVQHEDLTFNHPLGGQAKYLETPLNENRSEYMRRLAGAAREAMKG